ncbi:MAG: carbohydrate-binding protein [Bacteroidales bacterium]|nr:carbohydrate-binding protein [Bacteroidales bacterium]
MKAIFLNGSICLFLCGLLLSGCGCEIDEAVVERTIYVDVKKADLFYGDRVQITVSPTEGTFEWTSDDPTVATVANGLVEAVGVGTANIVVSMDGIRKSIPVTVTIPVADNVIARSGKERVQLDVQIKSDRIKSINVSWNQNGALETRTLAIDHQSGVFPIYADGLTEGSYTFTVTCFDKFDNEAVPIEITGYAFGDVFQATLQNRNIKSAYPRSDGNTIINWDDAASTVAYCELQYTSAAGRQTRQIPAGEITTTLGDYVSGLEYATFFRPEATAVDLFSVPFASQKVDERFKGPHTLSAAAPYSLEARNFDYGGPGFAYYDGTPANQGNTTYRLDNGDVYNEVDIESGGNIGYGTAGEWVVYTVDVQDDGKYAVDMELAGTGAGKYYFELDGQVLASCNTLSTDGWGTWRWLYEHFTELLPEQPVLSLTAGTHKIKFYIETAGFNFRTFKFTYKEPL